MGAPEMWDRDALVWSRRAAAARATLLEDWWSERAELFRVAPGTLARLRCAVGFGPWHAWWQAHALQVLLDGVEAGDGSPELVRRLLTGIERRQGGLTANRYYDDLAWLGLAALRAHELGVVGPEPAVALASAVAAGATDSVGGIRWRVGDPFHNVAATAPGALLLLGAAELAGELLWRARAYEAADWLHATLVTPAGLVWDGARDRDGVVVPEGPVWSYNIGTVAGLDVRLAADTAGADRDALLLRAGRIVRAGAAALRLGIGDVPAADAFLAGGGDGGGGGPVGAWRDEHSDGTSADPQLFRGILAGFAAALVRADPDRTRDVVADLVVQGETAWQARDRAGRFGAGWSSVAPGGPTLAAHLSGCLLLGALARVEAAGLS